MSVRQAFSPAGEQPCGALRALRSAAVRESGLPVIAEVRAAAPRPSSTVRTGHACADPGFQSFHELLVRERRGRAVGAGRPGPEDERIRLHMLDDVFAVAAAAIPCRVFHLLADLLLRPAFPQHRQRRELPGRHTRHEAISRVRRLVTGLALLRGRAVAVLSADDERLMKDFQIRLPGRLVLMAVDAPRMHDDAGDGIEQRRIGHRSGLAATAGDRQDDDERHKDAHGVSPQAERSWRTRGSFRIRLPVAAKTALASAGAVTAVPGSPIPPGFSKLRTRCTSIAGASLIRSVRTSWKFDCCTRPFSIVTSPHKAALIPKRIPPSICALTVSGFTTVPQSTAQTTRCTRTSPALDTSTSATSDK